jgi:translation initiation factor RLI1
VVRTGKLCIEVTNTSKIAFISERLCIGCGICPKKCPFDAINIINLPTNLETQVTHRYSANSFKLHRLPMPRPGQVLGLVGTNGIGKSTALKILSGKLKPNLGRFDNPPDWEEILKYFRGSELQSTTARSAPMHCADHRQTTSPRSWKTTSRPSSSPSMSTRSPRPSRAPTGPSARLSKHERRWRTSKR